MVHARKYIVVGLVGAAVALAIFAWADAAHAASAPVQSGVMNSVLDKFTQNIKKWGTTFQDYATTLYWGLAVISLVWTAGSMALRSADLGEYFGEFTKFSATTGFFWWILQNGPRFAGTIIESMTTMGGKASGTSGFSPSGIMDTGFDLFGKWVDQVSLLSPVISGISLVMAILLLIVCALAAIQMVILMITAWVLAYAGIFLLGFGGSKWTSEIAINYYKTVLQIGIQMMVLTLLIGVGNDIIVQYAATATTGSDSSLKEMAVVLVAAFVFWQLIGAVPAVVSGIVVNAGVGGVGSATGVAAQLAQAATAVATAATAVAAVASGTVAAAESAAAHGGGAVSAVKEAFGAALNAEKSGTGAFSGGSWGGEGGGIKAAVGRGAQLATETGSQLLEGVKAAGGDKMRDALEGVKESYNEKKDASFGSQTADRIAAMDPQDGGRTRESAWAEANKSLDPKKGVSKDGTPVSGGADESADAGADNASGEAGNFVQGGGADQDAEPDQGGWGGGGPSADHWSQQTGGVSQLTPEQMQEAEEKYEEWAFKEKFSFSNYVDYVQRKSAERREMEMAE